MSRIWGTIESALALYPRADLRFIAAAFAVDIVVLVLQGYRWHGLLRALGVQLDGYVTTLMNAAGNALTNLTPARALGGDAFRVAAVRVRSGASLRVATASVVYDRMADFSGLSVLLVLAAPRMSETGLLWVLACLAVILLTIACSASLRRRVSGAWIRWHDRLVGMPLSRRSAGAAVLISMAAWFLDVCRVVLGGAAFGAHISFPFAAAVSLARLGSGAAPVPGGVGVVDVALFATLVWGGLPPDIATAVALLERAIVYGWATLLGLVALAWLGGRQFVARARGVQA